MTGNQRLEFYRIVSESLMKNASFIRVEEIGLTDDIVSFSFKYVNSGRETMDVLDYLKSLRNCDPVCRMARYTIGTISNHIDRVNITAN